MLRVQGGKCQYDYHIQQAHSPNERAPATDSNKGYPRNKCKWGINVERFLAQKVHIMPGRMPGIMFRVRSSMSSSMFFWDIRRVLNASKFERLYSHVIGVSIVLEKWRLVFVMEFHNLLIRRLARRLTLLSQYSTTVCTCAQAHGANVRKQKSRHRTVEEREGGGRTRTRRRQRWRASGQGNRG